MTAPFRVALTFDAEHPDRRNDRRGDVRTLAALEAAGVRATFFIQGRWAEAYPAMAKRVARGGHLIGSHSHYHARAPLFTASGLATDVRAAERAIRRRTGVDPRPWFRLPFGAGAASSPLVAGLRELGYRHVGWNVEVKEWRTRETAPRVLRAIVDGSLAFGDGAIVLLHTWPDPVGRALPDAIAQLRSAGATFVPVDELDLPPDLEPIGEPRPAA
jgi:peptidoglycan/xylan/chitin deacetylase (PgdA/CDA1 family)